jgi:hypothetical protein
MQIAITKILEIDVQAERRRLIMGFEGEQLDRQLAILDALEAGDFGEVAELYDALPLDAEEECSEREYVGLWHDKLSEAVDTRPVLMYERLLADEQVACRLESVRVVEVDVDGVPEAVPPFDPTLAPPGFRAVRDEPGTTSCDLCQAGDTLPCHVLPCAPHERPDRCGCHFERVEVQGLEDMLAADKAPSSLLGELGSAADLERDLLERVNSGVQGTTP